MSASVTSEPAACERFAHLLQPSIAADVERDLSVRQSVSLSPTLRPSRIPQCVTPRTPALTTCVYILGISVCAHTWWGRNHRHEDGRRSTCHTRRGQIHVRHALTDSARPSSTPHGCCAHAGPHRCQKRRPGSKPTPPPNRRKNANMAALVPCSAASRSQPHQRRGRTLERAAPPAFSGNATAPQEVPARDDCTGPFAPRVWGCLRRCACLVAWTSVLS